MIFILNFLLIIFVIQVHGNDIQDVEIVMLPLWNTENVIEVDIFLAICYTKLMFSKTINMTSETI